MRGVMVSRKRWNLWVGMVSLCLGLVLYAPGVRAENAEEKPTANLTVDALNQYIFRGIAFSDDSVVIQPSMTMGYKGLSLNLWGNFDTNEEEGFGEGGESANWNETDITLSYSRELYKGLSGTVGGVYYALVGDDSFEVFAGLSYAFPWFTVGATAFREVSHFPGWWVQFDISRNFPLPCYGMSIDLRANVGYQDVDDSGDDYSAWHSGQIMGVLNIPVGKYLVVAPGVGFVFPLSDESSDRIETLSWDRDESHVFGGIRLSASF